MTETQGEAEIIDHVPTMRDVLGAIEKDGLDDHRWIDRAARLPWWVGVPVFAGRLWIGMVFIYFGVILWLPWAMRLINPDSTMKVDYHEALLIVVLALLSTGIGGYVGARRAVLAGHFRRQVRRWAIEHATWSLWGVALLTGFFYSAIMSAGSINIVVFMFLNFAIFQTFMLSTVSYRGTAISCASCGYPFSKELSGTCPECGAKWYRPDGLTQGVKFKRDWKVKALGLGVFGGLFAGAFLQSAPGLGIASRWVMPSVPDDTLVSRVIRSPNSLGSAEFIELSRRRLSGAQVERLATALLDPQRPQGRRVVSEVNWLLDQVEAGTMPEPLLERLGHSVTRGQFLRLLPRATVGFTLSPSVAITPRWEQMGRYETLIAFAGASYGIGEAPSVIGSGGTPLGREAEFVRLSTNPRFNLVFRAPAGGELVIRAEWFVVLMPPASPIPALVWRDDNTIEPPDDAAHIFRGSAEGVIPIVP